MKKNFAVVFLMMFFVLGGCSKNDDDFNKIVGEWLLVDLEQNGETLQTDICWQYIQFTFANNNIVYTRLFNGAPAGCESSAAAPQAWEQLSTDNYHIKIDNEVKSTINFENSFLIITNLDNPTLERKYRKR